MGFAGDSPPADDAIAGDGASRSRGGGGGERLTDQPEPSNPRGPSYTAGPPWRGFRRGGPQNGGVCGRRRRGGDAGRGLGVDLRIWQLSLK